MNKTAKIIIGILVIVSVFFLLYAQIQAHEAQKQKQVSMELVGENEKLKSQAEGIAAEPIKLAAMAREAEYRAQEAEQQLEECKSSK